LINSVKSSRGVYISIKTVTYPLSAAESLQTIGRAVFVELKCQLKRRKQVVWISHNVTLMYPGILAQLHHNPSAPNTEPIFIT